MKRFSDGLPEDREFEVAGVEFRWQYPYWGEVWGMFDTDANRLAEMAKNGSVTADQADADAPSNVKSIEDIIKRIEIFIDPVDGGRERWKELCSPGGKGRNIPYGQFVAIYEWLLEVTSGRPTSTPSPSSPGEEATEPTSVAV